MARRIAAGDRQAEEELIASLRRPLLKMLQRRTGDVHLADDLSHDALLLLLVRLRRNALHDPSGVSGYLYRTACNLLIIHRRRTAREVPVGSFDREDPRGSPLAAALRAEQRRLLHRSIAALGCARDREILHRFYLDEEAKPALQTSLALTSGHFDAVLQGGRERLRRAVAKLISPRGERTRAVRAVPSTRTRSEAIKNKLGR